MALLIADASYIVFHTYYAMLKFYKNYFNANPDIPNIMNSPLFTSKFQKMFVRKVLEIAGEHKVPLENVIFATDCERETIWRRDIYPDYKSARSPKSEFNPKAFELAFETIMPEMCREHGMNMIRVARAEADDIAGVIHSFVRSSSEEKIIIITNDNDYIQLADMNTTIVNLSREDLCARKCETLSAGDYLLCKILCGDKSDNIPGAVSRCGMKTAEKLVKNKEKFDKALRDNNVYKRFELNRDLMDMTRVPEALKQEIVSEFKSLRALAPSPSKKEDDVSCIRARPSSVVCT